MSRTQYRKAKDGNHDELCNYARALGMSVLDTHVLSGGLDALVGYAGVTERVEIKDGSLPPSKRKLSEGEQSVFDNWKGRKPVIWESKEDVEATRLTLLAGRRS